jgi:hypothetical protein
LVAGVSETGTNADHALIIGQIVGYRKKYFFHDFGYRATMARRKEYIRLRPYVLAGTFFPKKGIWSGFKDKIYLPSPTNLCRIFLDAKKN